MASYGGGAGANGAGARLSSAKYERFQAWQDKRGEAAEGRLEKSSRKILVAAQKEAWRQHGARLGRQRQQEVAEAQARKEIAERRMMQRGDAGRREHALNGERQLIGIRCHAPPT